VALQSVARRDSLKCLERAAVPIIKLTDDATGIQVDISFNMANGLRAAELIKHFKKRYPALPKLIYVLKQFLYQRDLNEVYSGGLSSYALILMVVSFLQQHIREDARSSKANLGVLLVEFFELYGLQFNYTSTAIRITDDGAYLRKEQAPCYQGGGYGTLCIEDPYDANNDVGKSSYGFPNCKKTFEHAYFHLLKFIEPLSPQCNLSLLSQVIRVKEDLLNWRAHLASCNIAEELRLDIAPEDPRPPQKIFALPSKDAVPTEMPDLAFTYPGPSPSSPTISSKIATHDTVALVDHDGDLNIDRKSAASAVEKFVKSSRDHAGALTTAALTKNNANKVKESDNMSAVSIGTSSLSSTSSENSSPASSASSDTDADAVIINGQATPNSAMSISPATSEVYSILDNGSMSGGGNGKGSSHRHHVTGSSSSSKHKSKSSKKNNRNRQQNSSNHVERSDLDLDWRAAATSTATTPEVTVAPPSGGQNPGGKFWNNQKNRKRK